MKKIIITLIILGGLAAGGYYYYQSKTTQPIVPTRTTFVSVSPVQTAIIPDVAQTTGC